MRRRARSPAMRILADTQNALAAFRAGLTPPVLAFLAATWVLAALNPTPESWAATCTRDGRTTSATS